MKETYKFSSLKKTFAEKEIPVLEEPNERTLVYVFILRPISIHDLIFWPSLSIDAPQTTFDNMKEQGNVFDEVKEVE